MSDSLLVKKQAEICRLYAKDANLRGAIKCAVSKLRKLARVLTGIDEAEADNIADELAESLQ